MAVDVKWLGQQVVALRTRLGLQQQELARRAGMSQAYVNRLEHGLIANPKINDLATIAEALDVPVDDLISVRSPSTEQDALAILRRHPWLVAVTAKLVSGLQWADLRDREMILSHLDLLVRRYGNLTQPADADNSTDEVGVARRLSLLRFTRPLPDNATTPDILAKALGDALVLVGGEVANIYRWDENRQLLILAHSTVTPMDALRQLTLGEGASGQAAARREAVVLSGYAQAPGSIPAAVAVGTAAAVAAPLLHVDRLLGAIVVTCYSSAKRFGRIDADALMALATDIAAQLAARDPA